MTHFQALALALLAALLVWELITFIRRPVLRLVWCLRVLIWLAAAAAIAHPQFVQQLARALNIGRGTDLLLYVFVLAFLLAAFYFYSRYVAVQRQLTQIVRHLALREAERGMNAEQLAQAIQE